jgi:hypothetical protein
MGHTVKPKCSDTRQAMYVKVTLRRVPVTIAAVEKQ